MLRILIVFLLLWGVLELLADRRLVATPEFTATTIDHKFIGMRERLGKPTLVTFWSVTCIPCVNEIPEMSSLHREFAALGFSVIGIAAPYDKPSRIKLLQSKKRIPYPLVHDRAGALMAAFGGIRATPTTFLIGPDGKIAQKVVGEMSHRRLSQVRKDIRSML